VATNWKAVAKRIIKNEYPQIITIVASHEIKVRSEFIGTSAMIIHSYLRMNFNRFSCV